MKDFIMHCKQAFSSPRKDTKRSSSKEETYDLVKVMKRVDAQIGRAVTRLSER